MNLIYYPDEFLTKEVKDVNVEKPELDFVEIKKNMTDIMLQNGGIGLAYALLATEIFSFTIHYFLIKKK